MKSYTDLKQSRIIAEVLPHDTADQIYECFTVTKAIDGPKEMLYQHNGDVPFLICSGIGIPCWSLAALLDVLESEIDSEKGETYRLNIEKEGFRWDVWYEERYEEAYPIETESTEELVDSCVEMILKLHEQKLL